MEDILGAIAEGLTDAALFLWRWKATVSFLLGLVLVVAFFMIHNHRQDDECRSKGGVPVRGNNHFVCMKGEQIK